MRKYTVAVLAVLAAVACIKIKAQLPGKSATAFNAPFLNGMHAQFPAMPITVTASIENQALAPTGYFQATSSGAYNVGGFVAPKSGPTGITVAGAEIVWQSLTAGNAVTIVNNDGNSSVGNRIGTFTGGSVVLPCTNGCLIKFKYDAVNAAWLIDGSDPVSAKALMQIQTKRNVAGCSTGSIAGSGCSTAITVTWPNAFPDTIYTATCWPSGAATGQPSTPYQVSKAASYITVNYFAGTNNVASWGSIDCIAVHD